MSFQPGHRADDVCLFFFIYLGGGRRRRAVVGVRLTPKANTTRLRVATGVHRVSSLESGRCRRMRQSCAILICRLLAPFQCPCRQRLGRACHFLRATKVSVDCLECLLPPHPPLPVPPPGGAVLSVLLFFFLYVFCL